MKAPDLKHGVVYPLIVYAVRNGLHHADVFHSFERLRKAVPDVKEHACFVMSYPRGGGKPYKSYALDAVAIDAFMSWMRRDAALKHDAAKYRATSTANRNDDGMMLGMFGFLLNGDPQHVRFFMRADE